MARFSYIVNIMVADDMATPGARASAAMELTYSFRNIPDWASIQWLTSEQWFRTMIMEVDNIILTR